MEDKQARFSKKSEPFNMEMKDQAKEDNYKSLVARIQNQVAQRRSLVKERPTPKDNQKVIIDQKTNLAHMKPLERFNITESRLSALNKSLLSRLSRQRAGRKEASITSRDSRQANSVKSRDRSNLKERINKLSTLERNLKGIENRQGLMVKKITRKDIPAQLNPGLSLLQKFQIYQLKSNISENSKSSKEGAGSFDKNAGGSYLQDNPNAKFKTGLDRLKKRIAKLPSQEGIKIPIIDKIKSSSGSGELSGDRQGYERINFVESQPIAVNIYKKKVDPLAYKRDDQSSLRILKARRSPTPSDSKRNNTMAVPAKIRIMEKSSLLN